MFELSNHLGNVLVTLNDKKLGVSSNNTTIDHFDPQVVSAQDYYPFGMLQPGRVFNGSGYRYGFNGKENDNEVKGDGMQQDYGMRINDPRLGRFLSVDPITKQYPELTPYQFASNSPVVGIDQDGLEFLGSGWLIDKAADGLSKLGMERAAGFVESYGHSLVNDPLYKSVKHVEKIKDGQYAEAAMDYDVTGITQLPAVYSIGKSALVDLDPRAQGQLGGIVLSFYAAGKGFRGMPGRNAKSVTTTKAAITEAQATANSGNAGAVRSNAFNAKKPSNYEFQGSEFWDDAIRTKEQLFDSSPKMKIQFGKDPNQVYHAFRHTDELGLNRSLVKNIIQEHFKSVVSNLVDGKSLNTVIEIQGQKIQYSAYKLSDGTINIGRIHGVK